MTCEIKSVHHPVQIRCSFPEVNETKRDFSVYYHSSDGSQNAVANCIFNGKHKCFAEQGFKAALEGLNAAIITVPESFATKTGIFICQKGDLPSIQNCQFPLIGNSTAGNSFKSEANVISPFVATENSGKEDDNQLLIISAAVSVIVVLIFLILCITLMWFGRYKNKKQHERPNESQILWKKKIQPSNVHLECKISFLPNPRKSNEQEQEGLMATLNRIFGRIWTRKS